MKDEKEINEASKEEKLEQEHSLEGKEDKPDTISLSYSKTLKPDVSEADTSKVPEDRELKPKTQDIPEKEKMKSDTESPIKASKSKPEQTQVKSGRGVAYFAVLLALMAGAGVGGLYYYQQEQQKNWQQAFEQKVLQSARQLVSENQQSVNRQFEQQQDALLSSLKQSEKENEAKNQETIASLKATISRLEKDQPSDWLLHEAEYLVRVAGRTLWLEHETQSAISLLKEADMRLKELNQPQYYPIRELIHQDIEQLKLMPTLETDNIILQVMALSNQVDNLTFASVHIPEKTTQEESLELSDSTADWQENLAKTWKRFLDDFITVSRRTANVEPLMSPKYQQNLRQNLKLKLQVIQWAASGQKEAIYNAAVDDVLLWLNEYFDMEVSANLAFRDSVQALSQAQITFDYPSQLSSLTSIRMALAEKNSFEPLMQKEEVNTPEEKHSAEQVQPKEESVDTQGIENNKKTESEEVSEEEQADEGII